MTRTPSAASTRSPGGSRSRGQRLGSWVEKLVLIGPGLAFYAVFVAVPVALIIAYAFATQGRFGGVEWQFTVDNFTRALDPIYLKVLRESVLLALAATLLSLLIGYPTAYAIAKMPPRWRLVALVLVVVPFWTNFLIRIYAWIVLLNTQGLVNDALLGMGLIDTRISMLYTKGAVVIGLMYTYLPLMILPIYASLERVDRELLEASSNLGATRASTFWRITFPLTLPGALIGSILVFVPSLGNFVVPELLGGGKTVMIGNLIRDQFLKAQDWPFGSVLAIVVIIMLVLLFMAQASVSRRIEGRPTR